MKTDKTVYRAYVQNESGAGDFAGSDTNLNNLKSSVRSKYGKGWNVTIEKVVSDDGSGWFPPEEVCKFTLRK